MDATSAAPDAGAAQALQRVAAATRTVRSYAFMAAQQSGSSTTRIRGRAVRPSALTYTLTTSAGRTEQVVRIGTATYRRVPPAGYRRLTRATPLVDPLASLVTVLQRLRGVSRTVQPTGTTFRGTLDGSAASAAGLVGRAKPVPGVVVPVVVVTDVHGRVTRLTADVPLRVRDSPVSVRLITSFSGFDRQPAIVAPHR